MKTTILIAVLCGVCGFYGCLKQTVKPFADGFTNLNNTLRVR